jgi:hypothetical protein
VREREREREREKDFIYFQLADFAKGSECDPFFSRSFTVSRNQAALMTGVDSLILSDGRSNGSVTQTGPLF